MNSEFSPNPDAPALIIGAAGVDLVSSIKGELSFGVSNPSRIRSSFGGVARNVSENLARLGQPVRLITAVGEDPVGEQLLAGVTGAGVDVQAVIRTPDYSTGSYLAVIQEGRGLQFALDDMGCVQAITAKFLRSHYPLFKESSLVFVDANLSDPALRAIFDMARRARIPVCADPTSLALSKRIQPYLERLKLVIPDCNEAGALCGREVDASNRQDTLDVAKCLVASGVEIAIVTLAQYGVCYATSETFGQVPAIRTDVKDPTGGGDAMTAAVLFALLNEIPLDDAVRLGVSAATLTLRHRGTVLPDLSLELLYDQLVI